MHQRSLLVATPAYNNQVNASYMTSVLDLFGAANRENIPIQYAHTTSESLITLARNGLAHYFLHATQCSHLLFIDGDIVFSAKDVLKMLATNCDVIAAPCSRKALLWDRIAEVGRQKLEISGAAFAALGTNKNFSLTVDSDSINIDTPLEIDGIGTGLMLIKREVFEQLQAAHPDRQIQQGERKGQQLFFDTQLTESGQYLSEDIYFCNEWRALGGKVHAALWVKTSHIGQFAYPYDPDILIKCGVGLG